MPYLSAYAMVIHYEEVLYQVYAPLPLPFNSITTAAANALARCVGINRTFNPPVRPSS